jgi:cysteinyl-tRNA synthetase
MLELNTLNPSIEPMASGHIPEQIEMIEKILENGFAYKVNGSVYFDVEKYSKTYDYGKLSGRVIEDLKANTRQLEGQSEKKNNFDFALWKKASPEHIMRWKSPWSLGFPGWHLECSVMSMKYLGNKFDVHGGGLDLKFPHHECEIAQSKAATGYDAVKYWLHNNLITIDGQKMSKSLGNFITLDELFNGSHELLEQAYSPQVIRFFILQAHYRNPVDFSNKALQASEKGLSRLMKGMEILKQIKHDKQSTVNISDLRTKCFSALDDDLNTPILISYLFDGIKIINSINAGSETISESDLSEMIDLYENIIYKILGLQTIETSSAENEVLDQVVDFILNVRIEAKKNKDYALSDKIRNELNRFGFEIKDKKDGFEWELKS